jgi:nucleotide-binding universal stress UspA family protein
VISVDGGMMPGPSGRDMAQHLGRHGIAAEAVKVAAGTRSVGETIIRESEQAAADLIVKGAYTRSRLRQVIFGGATEHVIRHSHIPVLLAH